MSDPTNFDPSRNATSLPGSADGLSPCASPGGPTIAPCGPDHAPASLSARQASEAGRLTSGTSGRIGSTSSASASLQTSLASRLQARMVSGGSILYRLTWKQRATPSGQQICALRASARPTSDSASISARKGWTTPQAHDTSGRSTGQKALHGTKHGCACLVREADLASWPTPSAMMDGGNSGTAWEARRERVKDALGNGNGFGLILPMAAQLTGWTTPAARDWKDSGTDIRPREDGSLRLDQLPR